MVHGGEACGLDTNFTIAIAMGGGTQGAAMAIICHPMFLEVGPRGWPWVARVKAVAGGGHLTTFAVP